MVSGALRVRSWRSIRSTGADGSTGSSRHGVDAVTTSNRQTAARPSTVAFCVWCGHRVLSRFCSTGESWPWAISAEYRDISSKVAGCSVGLYDQAQQKLLFKEWRVETTSETLRRVLAPCLCAGGHDHGKTLGSGRLRLTAKYPSYMCTRQGTTLLELTRAQPLFLRGRWNSSPHRFVGVLCCVAAGTLIAEALLTT